MAIVDFGINKSNPRERVLWDTSKIVNGHWIILGASGVGKTYQIRNIVNQLSPQNVHCYIFDPHGDIAVSSEYSSEITFSEVCNFGVNPFVINPSVYFGGVRRKINAIVRMFARYSGKMDYKQEAILRHLIKGLYKQFGYDPQDPDTWVNRKIPTVRCLREYALDKLKDFYLGNLGIVHEIIEHFHKKVSAYRKTKGVQGIKETEVEIARARQSMINLFETVLLDIEKESIEDLIKYESKEALKSVYDRIENIEGLGVFKNKEPNFDKSKNIWRYNMAPLTIEEQGYLVELTLEKIFMEAIEDGYKEECDKLIIIDEAQRFIDPSNEDHIISIISREGRKFGLGIALASQSFNTFPDSIILNAGSRFLLGVDECFHNFLANSLGIDINRIRFIQPRKNALIQIKTKDMSINSRFFEVLFSKNGSGNGGEYEKELYVLNKSNGGQKKCLTSSVS